MLRMDRLDRLVFSLLALLLLIVVPAIVGRAMPPYDPGTGRPMLMTASFIAERRYLQEVVSPALVLASKADTALEEAICQAECRVTLYQ